MTFHNKRGPDGKFISNKQAAKKKRGKKVKTQTVQQRDSQGRFLSFNENNTGGKSTPSKIKLPKRDAAGRFLPSGKKKPRRARSNSTSSINSNVNENNVVEQVTHVALVLDASSSMHPYVAEALQSFNQQLGQVKLSARDTKQKTAVSVSTFAGRSITKICSESFPEAVPDVGRFNYRTGGLTNLIDAVGQQIQDWTTNNDYNDENHSYLMIVITDGGENNSHKFGSRYNTNKIKAMCKEALRTERVTFAFSVPPRMSQSIECNFGVPLGCIQEWELSAVGFSTMSESNTLGTRSYFSARSKGAKKVGSFYVNADKIKQSDLDKMKSVKSNFFSWTVPKEMDITEFVSGTKNKQYTPGNGYYQLMKSEKLGANKDILLQDRVTGEIFQGNEARTLLGLPVGVDCKIKPGNHANFSIFINSTSTNRILVRGTTFLYRR